MKDTLFKRIRRKAETLIGQNVRYKRRYKPTGVYEGMEAFLRSPGGKDSFYQEVYPAHLSEFSLSEDFSEVCSDYLRPDPAADLPPAFVAQVQNARLYTTATQASVAVISQDNKVVGEASYQYWGGDYSPNPAKNQVFEQQFFGEPLKVKGVVMSLLAGYAAMDYFFHWLNDSLPKIKLVKESGLFDQVDWFLVPTFKYKYQRETLNTLGISPNRVIDASKNRHIQADSIITTSIPRLKAHVPFWVYDFYRNDFLRSYASPTKYPPLVYISRRDAQFRNVTNERELLSLARGYGFKDYALSSMSFAEQAKLFASARVILSPHGAGLSNLVFCKKGTQVIEFFAGGYVKPTYYNLSRKTELDYHYLVFGPRSAANDTKNGVPLNITVDLEVMKSVLDKLIDAPKPLTGDPNWETGQKRHSSFS